MKIFFKVFQNEKKKMRIGTQVKMSKEFDSLYQY